MTTTPNPTAEQIVAEAMVDAGAPLMGPQVEEAVVAALRAHGLLSEGTLSIPAENVSEQAIGLHSEGAPSEEQIERACVAYESTNAFGPERETRMRAALTAAGVAPQEPPSLDPEKGAELKREAAARALEEYAAQRYEAYLEEPDVEWVNQRSDMAKQYKRTADGLRARAAEIRSGS